MELTGWLLPAFLFLILLCLSKLLLKRNANHENLPPSPPALPVIGHLHLLKEPMHRSLHKLTEKYGHIIFLRFGTRKVLVVSSPSAVEECFTKNDIVFANRPRTLAGKHLAYNYKGIGFASYGDHWRNLRRLTTLELLSTNRLAMFTGIREEEVQLLVKQLFQECRSGKESEVELRPRFVELAFNTMLRMISGKRYYGKHAVAQEAKQFQSLMKEMTELGTAHINDFFPILQWVDFQGLEKRMVKLKNKLDSFFQNLLDEHHKNRSMGTNNNQRKPTFIDIMLSLQEKEPQFYTDENIKGVIGAMLIAGTESSATAMEWALSLLLNHPEAMHKLKVEIDNNVGRDRLVNESDLLKLNYLQNVMTETLRLYPAVPFLLPHENSNDCTVCGYKVPRGTMLLVNLWTMQRDGKVWADPTRFMPERFEGLESGEGYNMIPFGAGRRVCPGIVSAKRVMLPALGALIQCFEWEPIAHKQISMVEGLGITLPKVEPLLALCKPRPGINFLSSYLSSAQ